jgi:hypothetical protein
MADGARSIIEGVLRVPLRIEIQDKVLLASYSAGSRKKTISPTMLAEFAEIGVTGEESKLKRFAKRYGPIGICEHDMPCGHNRQSFGRFHNVGDCQPTPSRVPGWDQEEPLEKWVEFAKQAQAILACSANLHRGKPPEVEDLNIAYPPWIALKQSRCTMETSRALVGNAVNRWIHFGGLRPHLLWKRDGCSVVFSAGDYCSLFGALAVQLMLAAANKDGLVICSGCRTAYPPGRRPNPNQRKFCPNCGIRAAWRHSKQDLRNRARVEAGGAATPLDRLASHLNKQ